MEQGIKQSIIQWTASLPDTNRADRRYAMLQNTQTFRLCEAKPATGTYSYHAHITYFKGAIYTMQSNHPSDEDTPGQRVLMRRSIDEGEAWSELVELFLSLDRVDAAWSVRFMRMGPRWW